MKLYIQLSIAVVACGVLFALGGCAAPAATSSNSTGVDGVSNAAAGEATPASSLSALTGSSGFSEGEYGFNRSTDKMRINYSFEDGGNGVSAVWDAPCLDVYTAYPSEDGRGAAHSCTIHYGVLAASAAHPTVSAHPAAADAFGAYIVDVADAIKLDKFSLDATDLKTDGTSNVKVGNLDMCRMEGTVSCTDIWGKPANVGALPCVGYATVLDASVDDPDADSLAWFVVVDDPVQSVDVDVLSEIAEKTAQSFRVE